MRLTLNVNRLFKLALQNNSPIHNFRATGNELPGVLTGYRQFYALDARAPFCLIMCVYVSSTGHFCTTLAVINGLCLPLIAGQRHPLGSLNYCCKSSEMGNPSLAGIYHLFASSYFMSFM
jgi:hypothetical protein